MANRFYGSYRASPKDFGWKGAARSVRAAKRDEAEYRNSVTPHNHTKAHRLRCTANCGL